MNNTKYYEDRIMLVNLLSLLYSKGLMDAVATEEALSLLDKFLLDKFTEVKNEK